MKVPANSLQLFSVRETASLLNLSEHCIRRRIKERRLPLVRVRPRVLVSDTALRRFISKNTFRIKDANRSDIFFKG